MENKKKSKSKILIMLFAIVLLVVGASFAIWHYSYSGTENNVLSSPDLSFRFLESNNEVISIDNGVPMKDEDGIKQSSTGNVFDFEVKSKALMDTDVSYDINLEKLSIDSGKTALSDSDIKVYVEDFNGNTVLKPTKISDLSNYKLFTKVHRHSKSNNEISTKYKLKVWIDENVDVFSLEGKQYKFRVGVSTNQKEQDKNQTYSLVYNLDGGTGIIPDSTFKVGDKVTISSTVPVKAGYKFLGWSTKKSASSASYKAGEEVTLDNVYDGKVTLYAVWQGKTYTVKYDSNGGTGSMDDSVFKLATDVRLSSNKFSKENYTFIGWSTSKGGEVTYTNEAKVKDLGGEGDIVTLYAVWKSNTYTIKYDSNGGNGFIGESSYNYGNSIKLIKNKFTKDGYTFIGWNTNKDANVALYTDEQEVSGLSGNITLYAVWKVNEYNVNVTVQNGTVDVANKKVIEKQNGVFNLTPSDSNYKNASVSCTNNQTGIVKNNVLTVINVTKDTVCTVTYYKYSTVLYSDGTLILNEMSTDRSKNITTHSSVTKEYAPMDESNSYIFSGNSDRPWNGESSSVTSVEIGSKMTPTSTAYWFGDLANMKKCNLVNLDTSDVTTMEGMFAETSRNSQSFTLSGLESWNTSKVTNMSYMFVLAGGNATTWNIGNISNWNTSSVTNMSSMFYGAAESAKDYHLGNISNWDVSNVTNMSDMFSSFAANVTTFHFDLSNWDTSKVTNMSYMFNQTGHRATTWSVGNLSNWNVSNVTNMSSMFSAAGYDATTWNIGDLSNWDVSSVTNMSGMFRSAGYNATKWTVKIAKMTGSLNNSVSKWYGSSDSVYAEPASGRQFTLPADVNVVVQDGSLASGEISTKSGWTGDNFTFNIVPNDSSKTGFVSCTNNQTGTFKDNVLTVSNVTSDTTCTVTYKSISTVLYNDGTLIMNELGVNRASNTSTHGAVTKEYPAMSDSNSYVFSNESSVPWSDNKNSIIKVAIGDEMQPISTAYWFYELSNMQSGSFINLDVSNAIDMNSMFYNAGFSATSFNLNLSSWNVSKVTNMSAMFGASGFLSSTWSVGDLSSWDTSKVTNMRAMFNCAGRSSSTWNIGNLSSWDVSNVTNMSFMFNGAANKSTTWDIGNLSSWNVSKVTNMSYMFGSVGNTATNWNIGDISNWDVSNVTNMSSMFSAAGYNTTTWNIGNLSSWDVSNVTNMSNTFALAGQNATTWDIGNLSSWNVSSVVNMESMFKRVGNQSTTFNLNLSSWNVSKVTDMSSMFEHAGQNAKTWNIGDISKWDVSKVTNMSNMFALAGQNATTWDIGNLSSWDVSNVINMSFMFNGAANISTTWDIGNLSSWNTSKVTNMSNMFVSAGKNATTWSIGDLSNWDTSNVTDMSDMFFATGYSATTWNVGDLSKWNTSKVTNMSYMFANAGQKATTWSIGDLSNWDTTNVTDMSSMFSTAGYSATTWNIGDISKWDVSKVTNMRGMFASAGYNATTWNVGKLSDWDVSNVTDMSAMFNNSIKEAAMWTNIGDLSKWNTSKVTNMSYMFANLGTGTFNGISEWDVSNVTDMSYMFSSSASGAVDSLDLSKWNTSKVTNMSYMFSGYAHKDDTVMLDLSGWDTSKVTNMTNMLSFGRVINRTITIPKTSGSLTNTTSKWYGASEDVYVTGSFTLAT
mgnify:CR=1 FL=1